MSLIIKMDAIKTEEHLRKSIPYIMNEKKTGGLCFSNSGITSEQILDTFFLTKQIHPTLGTRQGYHFKFSFSKDETIEAEQALLFIKDWVDEYLAENYDYACSVHKDREHMHMHLVFNSVSRDGGKYRYERGDWENVIRPLTNCLAQKYHTGPLKEKNPALDYSTDYDKKKGNMTGRERVERDMDECILLSKSYADFKNRMVRDFHYRLREGVSREHGVYLALTPPGRGKAIRTYRLSDGYMPVDIDRRIDAKAGKSLLQKSGKRIQSASKLDWAMSRNYQFVPYKEMSDYQKAMVRQVLEARRLYRRTGTPLYLHEQSVRVVQRMKKDTKQCGIYIKRKEVRSTQRELEKVMKKLIKKHGIGATDGEWSLVYLGVRYGLSEQQVDEYLTLDTTELLLKHEKMLCIILGVDVAQDSKIPLIENPVGRLQMIFKEHFYKKESESGYEKVMQYIIKDTALSAAQIEQLRKAVEAKMPSNDVLEMAQNRKDVMEIRRCIEFYEMMRQKEESKDKSKKSRRDSR